VAALVVLVGAVVAVVVGVVVEVLCDEFVEELVVDVEGVELTVVAAEDVVPGISLDTTSPRTAAAPAATIATDVDVRLTLPRAVARRLEPDRSLFDDSCMVGMSPCESRLPRTTS
jgi:hypothetical protein